MSDSAALKLDRASEHVSELERLLREERPFRYVLTTNTETGERSIGAKRSEAILDRVSIVAGDAAHSVRAALDHAYWEIVSPLVTERQQVQIQFPFAREKKRVEEAAKRRLADKVSDRFLNTLVNMQPHAEPSGDRMLYLIDQLDVPDKHRHLIPVADFKTVDFSFIRQKVPDFPSMMSGTMSISNFSKDFSWYSDGVPHRFLGTLVAPSSHLFELDLDFPVDINVTARDPHFSGLMVPTLNELIVKAEKVIADMRDAAK